MATTAQVTVSVDAPNKALRLSPRMAYRELVAVTIANAAALPGSPGQWALYVRRKGATVAACLAFSEAGVGVLDLDTAPLAAVFEGASARRRIPFDCELWDATAKVLLGAGLVRIQNNQAPDAGTAPQTNSTYAAHDDVAAHIVLRVRSDGEVEALDPASATTADSVVGISAAAAVAGAQVTILREGPVFDSGWNWTPGQPVYAAAAGALTQVAPSTGACVRMGVATSQCAILLQVGEPLYL